ncbi:MAG: hypothetical protein CTY10_01000 [Methylotenera sp.]|nr:MAG: hypothetical protein BVN34_02900 [Proteobacteria bacterium ST_bin12]PPD57075.1 MAG: hypothetical protein CTY10_01000 [Methylotenera sp.]
MRFFALFILLTTQIALMQATQAAQPIGRLFSSPAERSTLNYLRQTKKVMMVAPVETTDQQAESAPVELPDAINVQGYVKRSDGKDGTVWINNQAMQENTGNKDVQVGSLPENGNRVPLKLPANGRRLTLKAGQVYDPQNNRVREARSHGAQGDSGTIGEDRF